MSKSEISRLVLVNARLYKAITKATEDERRVSPESDIPSAIEHPVWKSIKYKIHSSLMLWELAYLAYPYVDHWKTTNPLAKNNYFNQRNMFIYRLIDALENDPHQVVSLPPEIENIHKMESASIELKAQIKINIRSYKKLVENGHLEWFDSHCLPVWAAWRRKAKKAKNTFMRSPEPVRVCGDFNAKPFYPDKSLDDQCGLSEMKALEHMKTEQIYIDSYEYWRAKYCRPPAKTHDEVVGRIMQKNLSIDEEPRVQPHFLMGDERPEQVRLSDYKCEQRIKPSEESKTKPTSKKRPSTAEQYELWNKRVIELGETGKYRFKIDACRKIATDEDREVAPEYIRDKTAITPAEYKALRKTK